MQCFKGSIAKLKLLQCALMSYSSGLTICTEFVRIKDQGWLVIYLFVERPDIQHCRKNFHAYASKLYNRSKHN